jgi:sec-independent protein translocase protein TatA
MPLGPAEIAIVLGLALLIFGPKRLPDLGRSAGTGLREFKESVRGFGDRRAELPAETPSSVDEP